MVDFRSKAERAKDEAAKKKKNQHRESDARHALNQLKPEIRDYKAEVATLNETVAELRKENEALHSTLTEALRTQMAGVEEVKGILIEKMENLTNDLTDVHRKIRSVAESDMQLVKQLNDNQQQRIAQLSEMVKG